MEMMIHSDENKALSSEIYKVIDFIQPHKQESIPEVKKELPPEPKPPKEPPKLPSESQKNKSDVMQDAVPLNIDMPNLGSGMKFSNGAPKILAPVKVAKMDSVLTPMVQIKPLYPSRAKRMGIEGYVKVELDVDATGHVTSIRILESVPKGTFDKSVKKSVRKWKFRPKSVDGIAVSQKGVLTLKFSLGNE